MGLQEKKWKRAIEDQYVVEFKQDVQALLGNEMDVTVDWDSFSSTNEIMFVPTYGLDRVKNAVRELANDPDAKEEIISQIKTLHLKNLSDNAEESKNMQIGDGVFTLAVGFGGNHACVFNDLAIREYLENNL
ncbi:hypothetical protein CLV44_12711 [Marinobacterium halophilum]|uniref:Uncharacterized protein n=1 Tax=Marinobacterium halophilum TaxID=267374 RepID=A0A2P8ELB2_9GAMM|nr:hypothetical protein [Marinobacterium halophilum]PSL10249.1 hypothetical protein CLV44_12711 [Marinobacterium halophilum]